MSRRVAVATESLTTAQSDAFTNWARSQGYGWWHWIEGFWLLTSSADSLDVKVIADKLHEISPTSNILVHVVSDPSAWYGYGPQSQDHSFFGWLRETWSV